MNATRPPGGSVFLVEDEVMIRMMVADMLEELGYRVAAEAGEINEAIRLAQTAEFDLAILDVNVNGRVISPVAELIKARNRPFIFATGYGSSGLPEIPETLVIDRGASSVLDPRWSLSSGSPKARPGGGYDASRHFSVAVSACENSSSVRSSRSGVTET